MLSIVETHRATLKIKIFHHYLEVQTLNSIRAFDNNIFKETLKANLSKKDYKKLPVNVYSILSVTLILQLDFQEYLIIKDNLTHLNHLAIGNFSI